MFMMPFGSKSFSPLHGQFEPSLFIGPLSLSWLGKGTGFCIRVCPLACTTRKATKTVHDKKAIFVCCWTKCTLLPVRPQFLRLETWVRLRIYQVAKGKNCVKNRLHLVRQSPTQALEAVRVAKRMMWHERGAKNFSLGYGILISAVLCCNHKCDQCDN